MKRLDEYQAAAVACDRNAVVSAGAGSGKTTVLAARYVRLVVERNIPVDAILTLTFTKKAKAEMYARIHRELAASASPFAAEQLERFDVARIQTFDSFCAAVARGACHRWGVSPDFALDDVRLARIADEVALAVLMERRGDPLVRRLVAAEGFERVRSELFADFAVRGASILEDRDYAAAAAEQVAAMEREYRTILKEMEDLCSAIRSLEDTGKKALASAHAVADSFFDLDQPLSEGALGEGSLEAVLAWTGGAGLRKPPSTSPDPSLAALRELVDPFRKAAERLAALAESLLLRDEYLAAGELFAELARRMAARKRGEGVLGFRDVAELARAVLSTVPALRRHYKERIRAIMVDEFQDDDELQKDVLYFLAERMDRADPGVPEPEDLEPGKLFFVGDEKQSIYRFRGADVTVFRALSGELSRAPGGAETLDLSYNYRSDPSLVDFFNAVFPGVFGLAERDWEARFAPIKAGLPQPSDPAETVELHLQIPEDAELLPEDALPADEAEAFAAAVRIRRGVDAGEFAYGDVAVLFRSTTSQPAYEQAFRLLGIPFSSTDSRGLYREAPANDFYSLLRLVSRPRDRLAYAAVLRSPLVGVGDDCLAAILLSEPEEPFPEEIDPTWFPEIEDAARFASGRRIWNEFSALADRISTTELLDRFWFHEGYRLQLLVRPGGAAYLAHYEYLRALCADADERGLTVAAFLTELEPSMGGFEKAEGEEGSREGSGVVRIMTVHKSKGLEFPIVVLASAGSDSRANVNASPYYLDSRFGPVLNLRRKDAARSDRIPNPFFAADKERDDQLAGAELRRLLYVAATRAERKLILFGRRSLNKAEREAAAAFEQDDFGKTEEMPDAEEDRGRRASMDADTRRRLETALRAPRLESSSGAPVAEKSFMQLLAAGLAHPAAGGASYGLYAIPALGVSTRAAAAARFGAVTVHGTPADAAAVDSFYGNTAPSPRIDFPRRLAATALEALAAEAAEKGTSSSSIGTGRRRRGGRPELFPALAREDLVPDDAAAAFGELCHAVLEQRLRASAPSATAIDAGTAASVDAALSAFEDAGRHEVLAMAEGLAGGFLDSPLGKAAAAAGRRRSEFPFLAALGELLVSGRMDLVFESGGRCIIVDFKTDKEFAPEAHSIQLAVYRRAAGAFSALPPESWLFYLRGGRAVRVEDDVDLESLARAALEVKLEPEQEDRA